MEPHDYGCAGPVIASSALRMMSSFPTDWSFAVWNILNMLLFLKSYHSSASHWASILPLLVKLESYWNMSYRSYISDLYIGLYTETFLFYRTDLLGFPPSSHSKPPNDNKFYVSIRLFTALDSWFNTPILSFEKSSKKRVRLYWKR